MSNSHAIRLPSVSCLAQSTIIQIQNATARKPTGNRSRPPTEASIAEFVILLFLEFIRHGTRAGIRNKLVLTLANDQNGTRCVAENFLGRAAKHQPFQA